MSAGRRAITPELAGASGAVQLSNGAITPGRGLCRQRGVALLLVLWVLAVLSTLLAALAATVQLQHRQARWQADYTQALFAAQAGLGLAVMALQARDPRARWVADGQPHATHFGATELAVSVRSERGKLDLNAAPVGDLRRLLLACGASPAISQTVAQALQRQRNGDTPLRTLEEFRELDGVSLALYRQVAPLLTVWSGQAQPDPALAPAALAKALGLPVAHPAAASLPQSGPIFTIDSDARLPSGGRAALRVTLMLTSVKEGARPYRVLRWQE